MSRTGTTTRSPYDFYPTPNWCFEKLPLKWDTWKTAHEPCGGDGRITNFLNNKGLSTTYTEIQEGTDFFKWDEKVDLILTNPPFSIALEFIEHALPRAQTTIMLLRLNFLGSQKRYKFWINHEPNALYVLSKRPSFTGSGTDATEYAWYVWDKTNTIKPGIYHIL